MISVLDHLEMYTGENYDFGCQCVFAYYTSEQGQALQNFCMQQLSTNNAQICLTTYG